MKPPTVDRKAGVLRHLKIQAAVTRADREAARAACRFWEGVAVNPGDGSPDVGWIQHVVLESDGLYGDLHYLKSHPLAELVLEVASRAPRRIKLKRVAGTSRAELVVPQTALESSPRKETRTVKKKKPQPTSGDRPTDIAGMVIPETPEPTASGSGLFAYFAARVKSIFTNRGRSGADRAAAIGKAAKVILAAQDQLSNAGGDQDQGGGATAAATESYHPRRRPAKPDLWAKVFELDAPASRSETTLESSRRPAPRRRGLWDLFVSEHT
jgi:hypothetical protein